MGLTRPQVGSYAALGGYICALYRNELYDVSSHPATFRSFGISESSVRSRLWLVIRPPEAESKSEFGVYPRTDRNALHILGGPNAGGPLPINNWGAEFAERMPTEILAAIKQARASGDGTIEDPTWRDRLADRFGSRWRITRLGTRKGGPAARGAVRTGHGGSATCRATSRPWNRATRHPCWRSCG